MSTPRNLHVTLTDAQSRALTKLADRQGITKSEVIRSLIVVEYAVQEQAAYDARSKRKR